MRLFRISELFLTVFIPTFSPEGNVLLVRSISPPFPLISFNLKTQTQEIFNFEPTHQDIRSLDISSSGNILLSDDMGHISVWKNSNKPDFFIQSHKAATGALGDSLVRFSKSKDYIFSSGLDGTFRI